MKPGNPKYRYLYAFWAFLENLCFGGLIYGWGSLVFVLKDEGLYLDLCRKDNFTTSDSGDIANQSMKGVNDSGSSDKPNENSGVSCPDRDSKLALVFTIGATMFCVGSFVMGQINFKYGTRITRLVAAMLFIVGALMIAFTSTELQWLIFPGLSCLAIGGITYLMTNTQISLLFPVGGSAVIGLICGGFDASSGIQLLVKIGHENGISRQTAYIVLACAHLLTLVSTFLFLPKDFIKVPSQGDPEEKNDVELMNNKMGEEMEEKKVPSLMTSLKSPFFLFHVLWLSVLQLRFYYFLGSLNPHLEAIYPTKEEVSDSTNIFMYILMCGLFVSPFAGFVYDGQRHFFRNGKSQRYRSLMPSVIPLVITTVLCILWSGLLLVKDANVLYAVYVLVLFFRSFLYTMGAGFLSAFFPNEHFGILYGILLLVGGVISFLQYALFSWSKSSGYFQVNLFLMVLMFIAFIHPLYIWKQCWREKRSLNFN